MYIDPNSGGMILQALLVVFGVISGAVLIFSSRIKMGFARLMRTFREKKADGREEADPESNHD